MHVTSTVKSVPAGGTIRLAVFSLNDDALADALIAAVKRGVSVQIVANNHNITNSIPGLPPSPSFKRLRNVLGYQRTEPGKDPERVSFARICSRSCRGTGGSVHYKMFLFSSRRQGLLRPGDRPGTHVVPAEHRGPPAASGSR